MTLLLSYIRERLLTIPVAAAVLLVVGGCQIVRSDGPRLLAQDLIRAILLVVAFRIWDDVADRSRDRSAHPSRVTVTSRSLRPLVVASAVTWTAAAMLTILLEGRETVAILTIFTAALGGWYLVRGSSASAGSLFVLIKYAVFAIVIVGYERAFTTRGGLVAIVVYLTACAYEWAHDPAARISFGGAR
jgi:4-hydroxybenzoate polyprenyltransferase